MEAFFPGRRSSPTCTKADVGEQQLALLAMEQAIMQRDPKALHEAIHQATSLDITGPEIVRAVEMLRAMGGRLERRPLSTAALARGQQPPMADLVAATNRMQEAEYGDEPGILTSLFGPADDTGPGLLTQLLGPKPSEESGFLSRFLGSPQEGPSFVSKFLGTDSCDDVSQMGFLTHSEAPATNPQLGAPGNGGGGAPPTNPRLGPARAAPSSPGGAAGLPTQICMGPDGRPLADPACASSSPTHPQLGRGGPAQAPTNPQLGRAPGPAVEAPATRPQLGPVPTNPQLGHSRGGPGPAALSPAAGPAGHVPATQPQLGPPPTTNPQLGHGPPGQAPATRPQLDCAPTTNPQLGPGPAGQVVPTRPQLEQPGVVSRPTAPAVLPTRPQLAPGGPGTLLPTNPQLGLGAAPPTEPQLHARPWASVLGPSNQGQCHAADPRM